MVEGQVPGEANTKAAAGPRPTIVSAEAVREELSRVLSCHEFRLSKRSQDFVRYVVEHTLSGREDMLKERTIGIEVFGRSTSYEPSDDATVRVKAGDVRKRLGLYYAEEGARNPVRIELPAGTYVPEFRWAVTKPDASERVAQTPPAAGPPLLTVVPPTPAKPQSLRRLSIIAGAVLVAIAIAASLWIRSRPTPTVLDQFWAPVLTGTAPVSLCVAFVPVYGLNGGLNGDPVKAKPTRVDDFVLLTDQFVGGGDLVASSRISAMLARMQHPYQLRIGSDVSFQDLRAAPAILVGYSYTRWKEISSQLRFFIDMSREPAGITDNGKLTELTLPNLPADRRTSEDYAIVSRVFHPDTHAMLVELAGITQYGTEAAADLVTNSDLMAEALHGAPADWPNRNLQIVVHVKVISGTASSPKVVKTYFW
jgi:hypothetical protein